MAIVSGDGQTATIGYAAARSARRRVARRLRCAGSGRTVVFSLSESNGSLDGGKRQVAVESDGEGHASVHFTLGTRAGVGAQAVEAESAGFAGPAVFTATALPGEPALIVVDSGGEQIGIAGRSLPRPLVAAVTDSGYNRLGGVPVRFTVVKGAGRLDDGPAEEVVTTDSDGRAIVQFILDPEEGVSNNVVEARIDGLDPSPLASWTATGMTAGDPAQTSISGVVLDNTNQPVPGATVRIRDTVNTHADRRERVLPHPARTGGNSVPDRRWQHRHPRRLVAGPGVRRDDDPGPGEDARHAGLPSSDRPAERDLRLGNRRGYGRPCRAFPASPSTSRPGR